MPRWPNGGPKKIYIVVEHSSGNVVYFDRRDRRTAWLVENYPTYSAADITHLTYIQEKLAKD